MISSVAPMPPQGSPPPSALARVTMSGESPNFSVAPPGATVKPVLTSSTIQTMPCFFVISRTASR